MCVILSLFSALNRRVGFLQISFIIIRQNSCKLLSMCMLGIPMCEDWSLYPDCTGNITELLVENDLYIDLFLPN